MLVGRRSELRAIEALAAGARVGRSAVLVIIGEAGGGKTALLDQVATTLPRDMRLSRVVGSEAEQELGFGGLSQLVGAAGGEIAELPLPQARALEVALGMRAGLQVDRLAVGAGTLGILSQRAEARPQAVLIDDAHWLDHSSAEAVAFAARRLLADPILLVAAMRPDDRSPLLRAGLPTLRLDGLDVEAARELLAERTGRALPQPQVERLVQATRGNPLALLELGDDPDALDALGPEDHIALSGAITRAFLARVEQLSEPAQAALLIAACAGGDPLLVTHACRSLGVAPEALREGADAALVRTAGVIEFQHPLVRAALVGAAAPARLRAVHAALAAATAPSDPDRRAWHLAAACAGPDEPAARAMVDVAARAQTRAAHAVAATALERAAALSIEEQGRSVRLLDAAESAWLAGQGERALTLLRRLGEPRDEALTARAGRLHGTIAARAGSIAEAIEVFSRAALRVEAGRPDDAVELWADAVNAAFFSGDAALLHVAALALERLRPRVGTARSRVLGDIASGMALTLTGGDGADRIRRAVEHLSVTDTLHRDPLRAEWLLLGPLYLREEGRFRDLVQRGLDETRDAAALGELAHLLQLAALDDATTERWSRADAEYQESIALARELGQSLDLALALAGLAWLEARTGRDAQCRRHALESMQLCAERGIVIGSIWAGLALGQLELGAGRATDALVHFDGVDAALRRSGVQDMDLHPGPERVEALVRLGRVPEAVAAAADYHRLSAVKGQAWAMARAERALGMVAAEQDADRHFSAAAALHAATPDRFEAARTSLAHGASLRRRRRRRDARVLLRDALATFEQLGARHRADQAAVELAATGATAQRRGASRLQALTAQERQIAEMLAAGATTRAAATKLFLSPKTVEYHLRHIYTKLGVRTRDGLAAALHEQPDDRG